MDVTAINEKGHVSERARRDTWENLEGGKGRGNDVIIVSKQKS